MTTAYRRGIETAEIELAQGDLQMDQEETSFPRVKQALNPVSWRDWFANFEWEQFSMVVLGLVVLYTICLAMSFGLIELAEHIRLHDYRILPQRFYGNFVYGTSPPLLPGETIYPTGFQTPWNSTLF